MECLGPEGVLLLLDWLKERLEEYEAVGGGRRNTQIGATQGLLFRSAPYREEAPSIATPAELEGALEHLEYAVHRRFSNQLTRAERARLDNTIDNALFKVDRYLDRQDADERLLAESRLESIRQEILLARERVERQKDQARRADLKLAQLGSLTPEGFEEFVAEMFEALGYEVERTGGSGDEGADLRVQRAGLLGIVQCKYHSRGVVGSPDLQKFLGSIQHTRSHKGFFVSTRTFSLAAEKFAAEHPIELIDGPRLVELVEQALGPSSRRDREPAWF
ncbi:MAG TPA: restriction endonuclease [Isosphaeraceae bacterium]|nr:restriction endonuclease [Isosphaeraceae bacterium]